MINDNIRLDAHGLKQVKPLIAKTFPNHTGRKIYVCQQTKPLNIASGWDGEGNCSEFVAIDLNTLEIKPVPRNNTAMEYEAGNRLRLNDVMIPPGVAIVERARYGASTPIIYIHIGPTTTHISGTYSKDGAQ